MNTVLYWTGVLGVLGCIKMFSDEEMEYAGMLYHEDFRVYDVDFIIMLTSGIMNYNFLI